MAENNNGSFIIQKTTGISIAVVVLLILVASYMVGKVTALEVRSDNIEDQHKNFVTREEITAQLTSIDKQLQELNNKYEKLDKKIS